jgi:hypothetical protein
MVMDKEKATNMSYQKRLLGQQLGAYIFRDPPLVIANHELADAAGTFWNTSTDESITAITVSGPSGSIPGAYTAGGSGPPYTSWGSPGGDDLTLRSSGKWEFQDDGDVVWQSVDTDKLYPWNVQTWEVGPDGSDDISQAPVFSTQSNTLSGMSIFSIKTQTIFWGDGTSETFEDGDALSHTWTASSLNTPEFTNGELTTTTNSYMSGNYRRGSSKFYEKLI